MILYFNENNTKLQHIFYIYRKIIIFTYTFLIMLVSLFWLQGIPFKTLQ